MEQQVLDFRPLIAETSKRKPMRQIYMGFEIEKRFLLFNLDEDTSKKSNGLHIYNQTLQGGVLINQGYIKDIQVAVKVLDELGIELNEFQPNTIRLREFGTGYKKAGVSDHRYILTLKDRKEVKKREAEFRLTKEIFDKYWPCTQGARVQKKRMIQDIKGFKFEFDAFTDRILLIVECEVDKEDLLEQVPKLGRDITGDMNYTNKNLAR